MKRTIKLVCLFLITILVMSVGACTPSSTLTLTNKNISSAPIVIIEPPQNPIPPVVRISNNDYSINDIVLFQHLAEDSVLVKQSVSDPQAYLDSAVDKARELNLESTNLREILTKIVFQIDQLDFNDKNLVNGVAVTFMLSKKTAQLPYIIEKAKYQGKEAWLIALNWEMIPLSSNLTHGSHVSAIVFEYGTYNVLFAISCA